MSDVEDAVTALRAGGLAVIPTDTVYGLVADGASEPAARALYAAKGRAQVQPTALLFASVEEDADSAKALGIVGIVVGAVALLVALGALLARRRPTGSA